MKIKINKRIEELEQEEKEILVRIKKHVEGVQILKTLQANEGKLLLQTQGGLKELRNL